MNTTAIAPKSKPPYLLGLICIMPLVGAFVGIDLLLYGLFRYKDKWLCIIGVAGIAWTTFVYSSLFYVTTHSSEANTGFTILSQVQLNKLVKSVEFYKLSHGKYPDSLQHLADEDKMEPIHDPVRGVNTKVDLYYIYKNLGENYLLFSSGRDGIPGTKR